MPKNSYLLRRDAERKEMINRGLLCGQQYAMDCMLITLHRNGWGYDRLKRLLDECKVVSDYYADVLRPCMEQDVRQEQMDAELRDIVKGRQEFADFRERYPDVLTAGYDRLPRK